MRKSLWGALPSLKALCWTSFYQLRKKDKPTETTVSGIGEAMSWQKERTTVL